jgi:hypothetical protein
VNLAFAAAANGLTVGLDGPTHLNRPAFDPKLPGSWLVDLSHVDLSRVQINGRTVDADRLPSPFTPKGDRPTGPAWYATPTVAYAQELGFEVAPIEAYVRLQTGRYLDPWYNRLRDAYVQTMADLGVTTAMGGSEFLEAMARSKSIDPTMALLAKAIKATAKGGIGKLRQRNRGQVPYYEPWPALKRETWRPDIRAAVLASQRVGIHRKLMKTAAAADLYPVAIGTDAIVYPSPGPSPLDVLPYTDEGGLVREVAPELLKLLGVGPITATQILVSWSHSGRFRSEAAFASFAGVSPIPASSGLTNRHRLNRSGDRQLNRALHTISLIRMRLDPTTKAYVAR